MSMDLFRHNQTAYDAAVLMLAETGKAAVIHPTGTGKSFIGFKLCEDNPDKTVCWLSPSDYIFRTQLENLADVSDGWQPENIKFFTYAKLMNMSEDEISNINPDFVVLDEFHRCGAEYWGAGVKNLLTAFSNVPILGLSATAIRYLDNQRDMSDELFDGNIASEMTLGEAIVRGILNPPKYVLSVFSYQKDLEKYEERVRKTRRKAVRDAAARYLDALRRTLEKADGLDVIFQKHITEKNGKFLVFCSNVESMNTVAAMAKDWFGAIDSEPHIYKVYTGDPENSRAFADFKADKSEHLKLLYCIDMLNEGVHVEDISGVILLRPTVSPIIYKQQIGRALSASKSTNAVIFDIVANISNLYSISAVQEEMKQAVEYFRSYESNVPVINETFEVIDEVQDCVELFEKFNDTLTASWDVMYQLAVQYYHENGDLNIANNYRTAEGYSLGKWVFNQRNIRNGRIKGKLTDEQIKKLDEIGMEWRSFFDVQWEKYYTSAKEYYENHHTLDAPVKYIDKNGVPLGSWLASVRQTGKADASSYYLTDERKKMLEDIGMIWDVLDYQWEQNFQSAYKYYLEHRHLDIPSTYVDENGIKLGSWLGWLRQGRSGKLKKFTPLTSEQIARLDAIGMIWDKRNDNKWEKSYSSAEKYVKANGTLIVPVSYVDEENGVKLGLWIQNQRKMYHKGTLLPERVLRLNQLGMVWETPDTWKKRFELLSDYYKEHNTINISVGVEIEGVWLGKWINQQYKLYKSGKLTAEQRELLEKLPLEQLERSMLDVQWENSYAEAEKYYVKNGTLSSVPKNYISENGVTLGVWLIAQRRARRLGKLSKERIALLDKLGFQWVLESAFEKGLRYAKEYYSKHGDLNISGKYVTNDGYKLGHFIYEQRRKYGKGKLTDDEIRQLDELNMRWVLEENAPPAPKQKSESKAERTFRQSYERAKQFYDEHGHLNVPANYRCEDGYNLNARINRLRKTKDKLTAEQVALLDSIGMVWEHTTSWEYRFSVAKAYFDKHGSLPSKQNTATAEEPEIATWIKSQKMVFSRGELSVEHLEMLRTIGLNLDEDKVSYFEVGYENAKAYFEQYGNLQVPASYQCDNGYWLGSWLDKMRKKRSELTSEQIAMLDEIGMDWSTESRRDQQWETRFSEAEKFYKENGYLPLEPKQCRNEAEKSLWQWLRRQLLKRNKGELTEEQVGRLSEIGMDWLNSRERAWQVGYEKAKSYSAQTGDLDVALGYRCEDNYSLGRWLYEQRKHWDKLNSKQRALLTELGMKKE